MSNLFHYTVLYYSKYIEHFYSLYTLVHNTFENYKLAVDMVIRISLLSMLNREEAQKIS